MRNCRIQRKRFLSRGLKIASICMQKGIFEMSLIIKVQLQLIGFFSFRIYEVTISVYAVFSEFYFLF